MYRPDKHAKNFVLVLDFGNNEEPASIFFHFGLCFGFSKIVSNPVKFLHILCLANNFATFLARVEDKEDVNQLCSLKVWLVVWVSAVIGNSSGCTLITPDHF